MTPLSDRDDDKILVPICKDHFQRIAAGDVCPVCPSRAENEAVVAAMAKVWEDDREGAIRAMLTEIQSIRRSQSKQSKVIEKMSAISAIVIGPDGQNGLRSQVKEMRSELTGIRRLIWIGIGICVASSLFLPLVVGAISK